MSTLVAHGSIALIFGWLIIAGLGLPLPEDPALLAAGVLTYHGDLPPIVVLGIVMVGLLAGDVGLFLIARRLGPAASERALFRRLLPPDRRARLEGAFHRHGGKLVFLARHVAGLRAATFALAGIHGMALRRFVCWDALAACISAPIMVGLGYLGAHHIDRVRDGVATIRHVIVIAALLGVLAYLAIRAIRSRRRPEA